MRGRGAGTPMPGGPPPAGGGVGPKPHAHDVPVPLHIGCFGCACRRCVVLVFRGSQPPLVPCTPEFPGNNFQVLLRRRDARRGALSPPPHRVPREGEVLLPPPGLVAEGRGRSPKHGAEVAQPGRARIERGAALSSASLPMPAQRISCCVTVWGGPRNPTVLSDVRRLRVLSSAPRIGRIKPCSP